MQQIKIGDAFGKLKVAEVSQRNGRKSWLCKCECGNTSNVITSNLTRGLSKSCGKCTSQLLAKYHREYNIWGSMKNRCDNKNHKYYSHYGKRGIGYCSKWQTFEGFLEDMGAKPHGRSLDRIDNNGNYSKENCRWATPIEQKNNCRNNRHFTFRGTTKTMAEWAREYNINYRTLKTRVNVLNWPISKALTTRTYGEERINKKSSGGSVKVSERSPDNQKRYR